MIFELDPDILAFPPVELADDSGLLAVGGDLSPQRLLLAYRSGIFPWYSDDTPILWHAPDPRFVLFPADVRPSHSMRKLLRRRTYRVTADHAFPQVIRHCAVTPRAGQDGTWITDEMLDAYTTLHQMGYAHSIETWHGDQLVGGLYGISLGSIFFGESMFSHAPNASKAALHLLVTALRPHGLSIIDSQVHTPHLESLGGQEIPRPQYMHHLQTALKHSTLQGNWRELLGEELHFDPPTA